MGYEFDALVVALLGGVSIAGGFGSVLGMFVGALILSVVTSLPPGCCCRRIGSSPSRPSQYSLRFSQRYSWQKEGLIGAAT
jgi:hypothetical protein